MPDLIDLRRRRDLGDLLGLTFTVWWRHLGVFLALAFVLIAPATLLVDGVWGGALFDPERTTLGAEVTSQFLFTVVIPPLITAVHVVAVVDIAVGRPPSVGGSLRAAVARTLPLVGAALLYGLLVGLGVIALIIPGIWLGVACYFAAQQVAYDREMGALRAVGASYDLVKGSWWWTFGVLVVVAVISGVALVPIAAAGLLAAVLLGGVGGGILYVGGLIVLNTVAYSFGALAGTLLFFDLRARGGLDVPLPEPGPFGPVPERPVPA